MEICKILFEKQMEFSTNSCIFPEVGIRTQIPCNHFFLGNICRFRIYKIDMDYIGIILKGKPSLLKIFFKLCWTRFFIKPPKNVKRAQYGTPYVTYVHNYSHYSNPFNLATTCAIIFSRPRDMGLCV